MQEEKKKMTNVEALAKARLNITSKRGPGKKEVIKKEIRQEFKEKFEGIFGRLTNKMLELAEGYEIVIAREWEIDRDGDRHRTGKWKRIHDEVEVLDLMNGMDDGEEDSFHIITLKDPSEKMITYIADQLMGKAPQKLNVDTRNKTLEDILSDIRSNNKGLVNERKPVELNSNSHVLTFEDYLDEKQ